MTRQLTVTGTFDDGSTRTLSGAPGVALSYAPASTTFVSVNSTGLVTGLASGTEMITVSATIATVTRTAPVNVTVSSLYSYIADSEFETPLGDNWQPQIVTTATVGSVTYPIVEIRDSFDPVLLPAQEGNRFLYIEAPDSSLGGVSQMVNLPNLAAGEALRLDFRCFAKRELVTLQLHIVGPTSSEMATFSPNPLASSGAVEGHFRDLSAYAGQTIELRFLATSPSAPGTPGDTSLGLDSVTIFVVPTGVGSI